MTKLTKYSHRQMDGHRGSFTEAHHSESLGNTRNNHPHTPLRGTGPLGNVCRWHGT